MSKSLTDKGIADAAKDLGIEPAAIRAVDEVESAGDGFTSDGRPLLDVAPVASSFNISDNRSAYAKLLGDTCLIDSGSKESPNLPHLIFVQFRPAVQHALTRVLGQVVSRSLVSVSLPIPITVVCHVVAKKKVRRVAALFVVTRMAYQKWFRVLSEVKEIGNPMREQVKFCAPSVDAKLPVASGEAPRLPIPASVRVGNFNLRPKSLNVLRSQGRKFTMRNSHAVQAPFLSGVVRLAQGLVTLFEPFYFTTNTEAHVV